MSYNWYKISMKDEFINQVLDKTKKKKLPFNNLFGNNLRKIISLNNPLELDIINKLKNGETKSGNSYTMLDSKDMVVKDGDLNKRLIGSGKVIMKELGKEYADEWSRQVANRKKNKENELSIIISRSPIDILRMSDHEKIKSCRSQNRGQFINCLNEAISFAPIAYVVKTEDLKDININDDEIFSDPQRELEKGIQPISRIRFHRYLNKKNKKELAIPTVKMYGDQISGFLPSLTNWAINVQSDEMDSCLSIDDLQKIGGDDPDSNINDLFRNFYNNVKYYVLKINKNPLSYLDVPENMRKHKDIKNAINESLDWWIMSIYKDPKIISKIPQELKDNKLIIDSIIESSVKEIDKNPSFINDLPSNIRNDNRIFYAINGTINWWVSMIRRLPGYYSHNENIPHEIRNDTSIKEAILQSVSYWIIQLQRDWTKYNYIPEELKNHPSIIEERKKYIDNTYKIIKV